MEWKPSDETKKLMKDWDQIVDMRWEPSRAGAMHRRQHDLHEYTPKPSQAFTSYKKTKLIDVMLSSLLKAQHKELTNSKNVNVLMLVKHEELAKLCQKRLEQCTDLKKGMSSCYESLQKTSEKNPPDKFVLESMAAMQVLILQIANRMQYYQEQRDFLTNQISKFETHLQMDINDIANVSKTHNHLKEKMSQYDHEPAENPQ